MAKNRGLFQSITEDVDAALAIEALSPEQEAPAVDLSGGPLTMRLDDIRNPHNAPHGKRRPDMARYLWVSPEKCRPWRHHNRLYHLLSAETCADLIEGFRAIGRQQHPAWVRQLRGEERFDDQGQEHDFEIIMGVRRHWTVSYFQRQGETNKDGAPYEFLVQVCDKLSDAEAFLLSDADNRARKDISDYERAHEYRWALEHLFNDVIAQLANALQMDRTNVSRIIKLTEMPPELVAAYPSELEIQTAHWRFLAPYFQADKPGSQASAQRILACAEKIRALRRDGNGKAPADGTETFQWLKAAATSTPPRSSPETLKVVHAAGSGQVALKVLRTARSLIFELPHAARASPEERREILLAAAAELLVD